MVGILMRGFVMKIELVYLVGFIAIAPPYSADGEQHSRANPELTGKKKREARSVDHHVFEVRITVKAAANADGSLPSMLASVVSATGTPPRQTPSTDHCGYLEQIRCCRLRPKFLHGHSGHYREGPHHLSELLSSSACRQGRSPASDCQAKRTDSPHLLFRLALSPVTGQESEWITILLIGTGGHECQQRTVRRKIRRKCRSHCCMGVSTG
jgi:hypothetical protein